MLLRTLGDLALDGSALRRPKPLLLLAYLAFEGATPRRRLAELFFGDAKDPYDSLSTALKYVKQHGAVLDLQPKTVAARVECDAKILLDDLDKNDPATAVGRYRGPFLSTLGFSLGEELEEWVYGTREFLARSVRGALLRLAEEEAAGGHPASAASRAERAYKLPGAPELEPEEIEGVYALLVQGGSPRAAELKREAEEVGITLAPVAKSWASAPQTASTAPHNLPERGTAFIGRDPELAEVAALLGRGECRLLTLTGPGGIGKTRLALQVGWEALQRGLFGGVYFVPLESVTSPELLPTALARALQLDLQGQTEPLSAVLEAIGEGAVLLILDNFEHLLDGVVLVAELLRRCPALNVLATSRERLNLEEEWVLPVAGLPVPETVPEEDVPRQDAVQLFVQRAKRASLHFSLTQENAPHVLEICRFVGGSPLGIELAAAWVRMLPPEEIAREVAQDLDFLGTTSPSLAARHRSVRATFEGSWRLLKPREQRVLSGLSVFQEGFRREAASEVVGATLPVLASLVDKSLLRVTPGGRYDRHPLIYGYAQEKLDAPERARLGRRHAEFFLKLAQELGSRLRHTEDARELEVMEREHGNFRTALKTFLEGDDDKALRLSLALAHFWETRGHLSEGRSWLERALEHAPDAPLPTRAKALAVLGRFNQLQGNLSRAESLFEEGLRLWRRADDPVEVADCLNRLGIVALTRGDYARAAAYFQEGLDLYRAFDDSGGISALLNNFGDLARCQGDVYGARGFYEASLALTPKVGNVRWTAIVLGNLGSASRDLGDLERARALLKESVTLKYEVRDEIGLSYCFIGLAGVSCELGAPGHAATLLGIVDAMIARTRHHLDLADRNDAERTLSGLRAQMDPNALAAARDRGRAMSLDEAVAYALGAD